MIHDGDLVRAVHDGEAGVGVIDAVRADHALVRLTIQSAQEWTSPITGGTIPAGCPRTYLLWMPLADVCLVR
jgi:hypothetical protein